MARTKRKIKRLKHEARAARKEARLAPYVVTAQLGCGCCNTTMRFENKQSAVQAFREAGLTSMATIVDDTGTRHEGVDTFYGFNPDKVGIARLLAYLIEENKSWPDKPRQTKKPFK